MRSLIICTLHHILFRLSNEENEMDGSGSTYGEKRRGTYRVLVGKLVGMRPLVRHTSR
jgi:hypothetical protein